ncbi:MAG TPA: OB-fold domain-containing protein [Pseudonocardia sp.]
MNPDLPPQPTPNPDTDGFWSATALGRLELCWCAACERYLHPPLERCRDCAGRTGFLAVSGAGVLYSYIVVHRAVAPGYADRPGHVIGLVELVEQPGLRLPTQLPDVDASDLWIGMPMTAELVALPGGEFTVPVFRPAGPRSEADK